MQLDFRPHTTLGIIAVFTRVTINFDGDLEEGITSLMSWSPKPSDILFSGFQHFQGNLKFNGKFLNCYQLDEMSRYVYLQACRPDNSGECECCQTNHWDDMVNVNRTSMGRSGSWILAMLTVDIPRNAVIFPSRMLKLHKRISCIAIQSSFLRRFALYPRRLSLHEYITTLFTSSTSSISLASYIFLFCLGDGKNEATVARSLLGHQKKNLRHSSSLSSLNHSEVTRPDWNLFPDLMRATNLDDPTDGVSCHPASFDVDSLVIIPRAISISLEWLSSAAEFSKKKSNSTQDDVNILLLQLYELDFWLGKNREASFCSMLNIEDNAFLLMEAHELAQSIGTVGGKSNLENRRKVFNDPVDQIWCMFEDAREDDEAAMSDANNRDIDPLKREKMRDSRVNAYYYGLGDVLSVVKSRQDKKLYELYPLRLEDPDAREEKLFRSIWKVTGPGEEKGEAVIFHIALRAVLLGALLALGVDNSDVLQLETMDQIVPFM